MSDLLEALPKSIKRTVMLLMLGGGVVFGGDAWIRHASAQVTEEKLAPIKLDLAVTIAELKKAVEDLTKAVDKHR